MNLLSMNISTIFFKFPISEMDTFDLVLYMPLPTKLIRPFYIKLGIKINPLVFNLSLYSIRSFSVYRLL